MKLSIALTSVVAKSQNVGIANMLFDKHQQPTSGSPSEAALWGTEVRPWRSARPFGDILLSEATSGLLNATFANYQLRNISPKWDIKKIYVE